MRLVRLDCPLYARFWLIAQKVEAFMQDTLKSAPPLMAVSPEMIS